MRRSAVVGKLLALVALVAALVVVGTVLLHPGGPDYVVRARFSDAGQLVKGNLVQVAGVKVGSVHGIRLTPDGQAEIAMKIDDAEYRPLRRGTRAIIRQASLSGVANRYIDLQLPPGTETATIPPDGVIGQGETTSAVDLDQLFNTFDPRTRRALSGLIRGENAIYAGRPEQAAEPLRDIATASGPRDRATREGAFPATTKALAGATPELATARPYAADLTGWFDDFSHSGLYDALGGASRAGVYVNLFANIDGTLKPLLDQVTQVKALEQGVSTGQRWRCPGAAERGAIYKPTADFPCDASQGPLGK